MNFDYALILPCYNPPVGWSARVAEEYAELKSFLHPQTIQLIIVNDGSTTEWQEEKMDRIPDLKVISYANNRGKGYALRCGVEASHATQIIYTDIDFPYTSQSMLSIIDNMREFDIVAGSRNNEYYKQLTAQRRIISKFLRYIVKSLLRLPTSDTQCGIKAFRRSVKDVFLSTKTNRYLVDLEFLYRASKMKCKIKTVPVKLNENIVLRRMPVKVLLVESYNLIRLLILEVL